MRHRRFPVLFIFLSDMYHIAYQDVVFDSLSYLILCCYYGLASENYNQWFKELYVGT